MCVNACARALQGRPVFARRNGPLPQRGKLRAHRQPRARALGDARALAARRRPWPVESQACVLGGLGPPPAERKGGAATAAAPGRCRMTAARPRPLVTRCHVLLPRRRRVQTMASQTAGRLGRPPAPKPRLSADTYSLEPALGRPLCARDARLPLRSPWHFALPPSPLHSPVVGFTPHFSRWRDRCHLLLWKHFLACPL